MIAPVGGPAPAPNRTTTGNCRSGAGATAGPGRDPQLAGKLRGPGHTGHLMFTER